MNNKPRLPWYIWFSVIDFAILWGDTARRIKFSRVSFWDDFDLWSKACFNMIRLFVMYILAPIIILSILIGRIFDNALDIPFSIEVAGSILLFLALYLSSVYAVYRHIVLRRTNIVHLLSNPLQPRRGLSALIGRMVSALKSGGKSTTRRR